MILNVEYDFMETVYLKTDTEQKPRLITAVTHRDGGYVAYELSSGTSTSHHVPGEFTREKDHIIATNN